MTLFIFVRSFTRDYVHCILFQDSFDLMQTKKYFVQSKSPQPKQLQNEKGLK